MMVEFCAHNPKDLIALQCIVPLALKFLVQVRILIIKSWISFFHHLCFHLLYLFKRFNFFLKNSFNRILLNFINLPNIVLRLFIATFWQALKQRFELLDFTPVMRTIPKNIVHFWLALLLAYLSIFVASLMAVKWCDPMVTLIGVSFDLHNFWRALLLHICLKLEFINHSHIRVKKS